MELFLIRIFSVVGIAFAYMLFDVFNHRNVPTVFAYASVVYGAILTVLYLNITTIALSGSLALLILGIGYLFYKGGQLGAADVTEFAALSLILPLQIKPLIFSANHLGLPFIVSLIINGGISAFVIILVYYLPKAKIHSKKPLHTLVSNSDIAKAIGIAAAYSTFIIFIVYYTGFYFPGVLLVLVILLISILVILFEKPLTNTMVSYVSVDNFEPGDIIATNLISQKESNTLKKRLKYFNRLVTEDLISDMKRKKIYKKLPVYKNAMPLALPIFLGVCISLLFGDVLLIMLPFASTMLALV